MTENNHKFKCPHCGFTYIDPSPDDGKHETSFDCGCGATLHVTRSTTSNTHYAVTAELRRADLLRAT